MRKKISSERVFPKVSCWLTVTTMPSEETKVRPQHFWFSYGLLKNIAGACYSRYRLRPRMFIAFLHFKFTNFKKTVLHYGWIPFIIYVGYTRSNPQPSLIKCVCESSLFPTVSNWTG